MDRSPEARDLMLQQRVLFKILNNRLKKHAWSYDQYSHDMHSPPRSTLNSQSTSPVSPHPQRTLSSPLYSISESAEETDSCQRRSPSWSENSAGKVAMSECGPTFSEHILFDPTSEEEMSSRTAADRNKHYLQTLDELYGEGEGRTFPNVQSRVKKKGPPLWKGQPTAGKSKSAEVSTQRQDGLLGAGIESTQFKEYLQALVTLEKEQKIRKDRLLKTVFALNNSGNKQLLQESGSQTWSDGQDGGRHPHSNKAAPVMANPWNCDSVRTNCSQSNSASKRDTNGALQGKRRIRSGKLAGGDNLETDASQNVHRASKSGFPKDTLQATTEDVTSFNSETQDSSPPRKKDGFDLLRMLQAFFSGDSTKTLHNIFFKSDSTKDQASKEGENGGDINPEEDDAALPKAQELRSPRNGNDMRAGCGDMRRPGSSHDTIGQQYVGNFTETDDSDVSDSDSDSVTSVVSAIQRVSPRVPKLRAGRFGHQQTPTRPLHREGDVPKKEKTQANMMKGAEFLVQAICDNIQYLVPEYLNSKFPADDYGTRYNSSQSEEEIARRLKAFQERKRKIKVRKTVSELMWDGTNRKKHKPLNKKLYRQLWPRCLADEDAYAKTCLKQKYSNMINTYQQKFPNIYQKENRKLLTNILMKSKSQSRSNLTQKQSSVKQIPSTPSLDTDWKDELMKLTQDVYDNPTSPDLFDLSTPEPVSKRSSLHTNRSHDIPWRAFRARLEDRDSDSDETWRHDQNDTDATTVSGTMSAHTSPCLACRAGVEGSSHKVDPIDFLDNLTKEIPPEQSVLQPTWSSFSPPVSHKKKYASASNIFTQQPKHFTEKLRGVYSDTGRRAFSKQPSRDQTSAIMRESRDLLLEAISESVKDLLKNRFPSSNFTPADIQAAAKYVTANTTVMASLYKLVTDSLGLPRARVTQQHQRQQQQQQRQQQQQQRQQQQQQANIRNYIHRTKNVTI